MNNVKKIISSFLILFILSSCATSPATEYRKQEGFFKLGYQDKHIEEDVYWVAYIGAGGGWSPDPMTAEQVGIFLRKRSLELCQENNYSRYILVGDEVYAKWGDNFNKAHSYIKCSYDQEGGNPQGLTQSEVLAIQNDIGNSSGAYTPERIPLEAITQVLDELSQIESESSNNNEAYTSQITAQQTPTYQYETNGGSASGCFSIDIRESLNTAKGVKVYHAMNRCNFTVSFLQYNSSGGDFVGQLSAGKESSAGVVGSNGSTGIFAFCPGSSAVVDWNPTTNRSWNCRRFTTQSKPGSGSSGTID